jgi:hypothetical protein
VGWGTIAARFPPRRIPRKIVARASLPVGEGDSVALLLERLRRAGERARSSRTALNAIPRTLFCHSSFLCSRRQRSRNPDTGCRGQVRMSRPEPPLTRLARPAGEAASARVRVSAPCRPARSGLVLDFVFPKTYTAPDTPRVIAWVRIPAIDESRHQRCPPK